MTVTFNNMGQFGIINYKNKESKGREKKARKRTRGEKARANEKEKD
jgi:hypothetical protein